MRALGRFLTPSARCGGSHLFVLLPTTTSLFCATSRIHRSYSSSSSSSSCSHPRCILQFLDAPKPFACCYTFVTCGGVPIYSAQAEEEAAQRDSPALARGWESHRERVGSRRLRYQETRITAALSCVCLYVYTSKRKKLYLNLFIVVLGKKAALYM